MTTPREPYEPPPIGPRLSEARNRRGLSLTDAERQTRIPRRYLQALEADQFDVLPAPVYARGFLRNYARFLGLDENELLKGVTIGPPQQSVLPILPQRRSNSALWMVAGLAFGVGILLWAALGLRAFDAIDGIVDDIGGGGDGAQPTPIVVTSTPTPSCDVLLAQETLTDAERAFVEANCATPTPEPPTPVPGRTCDEIRGTDYESAEEREFFLGNCLTPPAG